MNANPTNDKAGRQPGLVGKAETVQTNHSILAKHYCYCRPGTTCIFCLTWNRLIRRLEARRLMWGTTA